MRSTQRYLILGLATAAAPIAIVVAAPQAGADCNYAGGATVVRRVRSAVRTGCRGPRLPYVPYPCENDWYCGTDWDLNFDMDPGFGVGGLPGRPGGIGPRR